MKRLLTISLCSSEKKERGVEVKIEEKDQLCKLVINKADEDEHAGDWEVVVYGDCRSQSFTKRRGRRSAQAAAEGTEEAAALQASLVEVAQMSNPVKFPGPVVALQQQGGVLNLGADGVLTAKNTRTE